VEESAVNRHWSTVEEVKCRVISEKMKSLKVEEVPGEK
jgi:hypothetical protein